MSRSVALAVAVLALLAAVILPLRPFGLPSTQAQVALPQPYTWDVLPGLQQDRLGAAQDHLTITGTWGHFDPEALIAIVRSLFEPPNAP